MNKRKSSSSSLKMYSNIINNLAKDITNNTKIIQSLKTKVSVNSKFIDRLKRQSNFSIETRNLKSNVKKTIEKDNKIISDLMKKNERLRKSQEQYISKLKEIKRKNSRSSYSTKNSSASINSIIDSYSKRSSDKELDSLLDEVDNLLKMKMKLKSNLR